MGKPRYRYHITPSECVDNILKVGLIPAIGNRSAMLSEPSPAIYLFPDVDTLEDAFAGWLGDVFDEDQSLALLVVDTQGLEEEGNVVAGFELMLREPVSVGRVTVISRDIDSEPKLAEKIGSVLNKKARGPARGGWTYFSPCGI